MKNLIRNLYYDKVEAEEAQAFIKRAQGEDVSLETIKKYYASFEAISGERK